MALAGQHLPLIRLDKPHLQYDNTQGKGSSAPQLSVKKRNYSSLLPTLQVSSMRLPFRPEGRSLGVLWSKTGEGLGGAVRLELGEGGCVAGCSVLGGACSVLVRALSDYLYQN